MDHPTSEMMDSLGDLRLFAAVAAQLSFTGAARATGVPVSTVSRRLAQLEETLGLRLLQRTSRRVGLTCDGARLLERARPLLGELEQVLETARDRDDQPAGLLRVTAPIVTGSERIAPALIAFAARYPRVSVELRLTNAVLDLVGEGFDLAFRPGPPRDQELVTRRLWSYPYALVASQRFVDERLDGRTRLDAALVERLPGVVSAPGRGWAFRRTSGAVVTLRPTERLIVDEPRVAARAAAEGLGLACVGDDLVGDRRLVRLDVRGMKPAARELHAVYPSRRLLPSRVRLAIDWVAKHG